ncbi:MAG TPA: hypothetical protein VFZ96_11020 [Actinomycetota bacterium]|nr:hypothetical protein [Actinomycetota bacterium]
MVLAIGLVLAAIIYFQVSREPAEQQVVTSSAPPLPSLPPVVSATFNGRESTIGRRLEFAVIWLDHPSDDCVVHTFTYEGKTRGGAASDCASWENTGSGYDLLLFRVGFKNRSGEPVTLTLRDFVLTARDGRRFGPIDVRADAESPTSFLPETEDLAPNDTWYGYVAFDARQTGDLVPGSLNYVDGNQTLRQTFEGEHDLVPPS